METIPNETLSAAWVVRAYPFGVVHCTAPAIVDLASRPNSSGYERWFLGRDVMRTIAYKAGLQDPHKGASRKKSDVSPALRACFSS